ncbi:MAG: NAD(P)/FAD-dependent oxidoreductase [Candidatus Limnocylindrales bacterium]
MTSDVVHESHEVVVIGGGQAGLATGYHLARRGIRFVILDAADQVGDSWRNRWDSLRLFTARRYSGLPGMPFPGPRTGFPTKDEVAGYLAAYATQFELPIRLGTHVERVSRSERGGGFEVVANGQAMEAGQVVIASGAFHTPRLPDFAGELHPAILQLHSSQYRRPSQLRDGPVLVVGAANSGGEIALDVAGTHPTTLIGPDTGHFPVDLDGRLGRMLDPLIWFGANHILTIHTPIGRKVRSVARYRGHPVERARPDRVQAAGIERRVGRVVAVLDGLPLLDDGQAIDTANVIWCTGWRRDYSWIDLPILRDDGWPDEHEGVVDGAPGLFFVGLPFQRAIASSLLGAVGRDAAAIVDRVIAGAIAASSVTDRGASYGASLERA